MPNLTIYNQIKNELHGKNVTLVVVSKNQPTSSILTLYQSNQRIFGENKVQDLCEKYNKLPKDIEWHFIGHLQSNKIKAIAPFISLIHSVDSKELCLKINTEAAKNNRVINCLLQVYIATEQTKFGLTPAQIINFLSLGFAQKLSNIRICGLMGMASNTNSFEQINSEFKALKQLFDTCKLQFFSEDNYFDTLSMGMSADYKIALACGTSMVRIGSILF